jgi:hypothetical protein
MRAKKFDEDLIAALNTLGFKIEDDQDAATATDVQLILLWPTDKLAITIELPNGRSFVAYVERTQIINRADLA